MGRTKPLGVMSPHIMILAGGWRISTLSILDDTSSTTEQDGEDGESYKKNMKVVDSRRAKRKHIRLVFILKNSLASNRKIVLNINTKAVYMPSILAMDWKVARQLDVFMQVGFTESKNVRSVLEHKCFKICEISPQTSYIGVVGNKKSFPLKVFLM